MTCLFGWIPRRPDRDGAAIVQAMQRTLAAGSTCRGTTWRLGPGAIGALDHVPPVASSSDGRLHLWAVGEVFSGLSGAELPADAHSPSVRAALLRDLRDRGAAALAGINGEFQIALWDDREQSLVLACDRFGCLPLYWAATAEGFAFGGSVAALLQAPGVSSDPDEDALREAVTFGGFRLGDRTNVRGVRMLRGARLLTLRGADPSVRRYWCWPPPPDPATRTLDDLIEEAHVRWQSAVGLRLRGATCPGTTLSGGLDSRAVMAEAAARGVSFRALTYGLPRCDDARLARRAAAQAGARWTFAPAYEDGWLDRRTHFIQQTDGLVQLADLLHFENVDRQSALMDVALSGYIGDVVCGDTYADVVDPASLLQRLPYSGVPIAWPIRQAQDWAERELESLAPAAARFVVFEHKFPQAIHRIFQFAQNRIRVRRPFVDYDLFDFYAGLDAPTRVRVYHGMLKSRYPALFRIPYQKTNAPVLTPASAVQARRVARFAVRRMRDAVARTGLVLPAPSRSYHDEERHWQVPPVRQRIVETILRRGSISAEIFGRAALSSFLDGWFARSDGPVQTVGALYVFEHYHQHLSATVRPHVAVAG
jgi:asparagine synthetase B (glutamine-hydrolysing)